MKSRLIFTIIILFTFTSCKSEYEERMEKARAIKSEIERLTNESEELGLEFEAELNELESQIELHAKISGNQELFLKELFY